MTRTLALAALLAVAPVAAQQPADPPAQPADTATSPPPASPPATPPLAPAPVAAPSATEGAQPVPVIAYPNPPPPPPPAPVASAQQTQRRPFYTYGSVGTTLAYGQTYGSVNLGVGYIWKAGLAPNVELSYAFGNTPTLWTLRPGVTWYLPVPALRPYVGAYYAHWFVGSNQPDQNGLGGRAGLSLGRVLSIGVTYDHALGCTLNCDAWTPQVSAGLAL